MNFQLGYTISSLPDHRLPSAVEILQGIGYRAVVVTVNANSFNPIDDRSNFSRQLKSLSCALLPSTKVILDTDCRYLIDPLRQDEPSLVSLDDAEARLRIDLLKATVQGAEMFSNCSVILSSGRMPEFADVEDTLRRLSDRIAEVVKVADDLDVSIALRPKKTHAIATISNFERLFQWLDAPDLQLAADLVSMSEQGELPATPMLARHLSRLSCVLAGTSEFIDQVAVKRSLVEVRFGGTLVLSGDRFAADPLQWAESAFSRVSGQQGSGLQ